ncbi:hypothetical protein EV360DRAFT_46392 [Lentinula raphanica]|nr:hypothetical protein EV360DRAFT_46392 [Lentinula raphanica]
MSSSFFSSSHSSSSPLDSLFPSIRLLLSRALSLPCSTAAQAFTQLVQPHLRFQVALYALLPNNNYQVAQRILVAFILFSLYAPHPISINPFRSALLMTFVNEKERAIRTAKAHADAGSMIGVAGTTSSEQLVWVLWKILRGDGNDIGPYSPSTLARSPLPPKLAAINLFLDETDDNDLYVFLDLELDIYLTSASKASSFDTHTDANVTTNNSHTTFITPSEDLQNAAISRGLALLLAARERVLTLSERRSLEPIFPALAASDVITANDLSSIVTYNPDVAYPLFVEMLTASASSASNFLNILDILPYLPPTLFTFDFTGKLLRDTRLISLPNATRHLIEDDGLVRDQVLARFMHECIERLEKEERERTSVEGPGSSSDGNDAWGRGVRNLCRFYLSLIKLNIVQSPSSFSIHGEDMENNHYTDSFSADSVEIAHFALRNSRFEEARMLYGVLATGDYDI